MKPQDLIYPFRLRDYSPLLSQGVLFIPKRLPDHYLHDFSSIFPTDRPVFIEFCSGNGEWIVSKALQSPDIFWIAIEMKFDRLQKIWSKAQNQGVKNLLIIHGEASLAVRYYLPENLADQFFINFPDPWPKFCHAKYRLINQEFLCLLSKLGKKESTLTFVSDDEDYIRLAQQEIIQSSYWGNIEITPFSEAYGNSYFYRLWKSKEKVIQQLKALNLHKKLVHPLRLDLSLSSDLKWNAERQRARQIVEQGYKLQIHVDFQIELSLPSLSQVVKFNTYLLSVETFSTSFYPEFEGSVDSVVFYKGPLDFIGRFFQKPIDFEAFREWLKESYGDIALLSQILGEEFPSFEAVLYENFSKKSLGRQLMRLFAVSIFSEYLHRLASKLPEDVIPALVFDRAGITKEIFYQQLISQDVFPHFRMLSDQKWEEPTVAVVIPSVEYFSQNFVKLVEKTIEESKEPLCFIAERYLSENWLGIDQILVSHMALSPIGKRQLKGFEAAGGEVIDLELSKTLQVL